MQACNFPRMYDFSKFCFKFGKVQAPEKVGVLKNYANFTRTHLCWSLFLIKFQAGLKVKFLRTPTLKNICERLILKVDLLKKHITLISKITWLQIANVAIAIDITR